MRMISWNMNKAHCDSPSWKYLLDRAPDLVFLQEVNSVPQFVLDTFPHRIECAIRPNDKPQKFHTVILVRGIMGASIKLQGSTDWLNAEHERFKGNLVANQVIAGEWVLRVQAQSLRLGPASISRNDFSTIRLYVSFPTAWLSKALVP